MTKPPDGLEYLRARALPPPTREQERALALRARKGDRAALDTLTRMNVPLAIMVARKHARGDTELLRDLVQQALLGVTRAVQSFEPQRGHRFSTYYMWWAKAFVSRAALVQRSLVRHPIGGGTSYGGRPIGEPVPDQRLDVPTVEGGDTHLDMLPSPHAPTDDQVGRARWGAHIRRRLGQYLQRFSPVAIMVIERRLMADEPWTLNQIGDCHGLSRERVRQIENSTKQFLARVLADLNEEAA